MATRRNLFQGQFGINETPLTIAIEYGNFKDAEDIIQAISDPSFLNDGQYENIPLHMVLTNNHHHTDQSRNLKIAKLLVQKGANPNLRIPYEDLDRASPSPFEELVVYHEVLKSYVDGNSEILCEELNMYFELEEIKLEFITNTVDFEGAKCMPTIESCHKLIKQTSDLIDVFLEYGSDPNVVTTFAHKTLFHWVIEHEDIELAKRFLDTCRVNLNLCDIHGNSPLMDAILRNDCEKSLSLYEAMCDTVDFIDVNMHNCCGETALFRAAFVGAIDLASRLCEYGAQIQTNVSLSQVPITYPFQCLGCSSSRIQHILHLSTPLLAPLLADAPTRLRYTHVSSQDFEAEISRPHKHLIDKIVSSSVSPLIDKGCFNNQAVASEVTSLLSLSNFERLRDGRIQPTDLILLMFGQVSAGLRQLCIRSLFDYVFMVSEIPKKTWPNLVLHDLCIKDCKGALMESYMTDLIELLGLPQSFTIFFEIEAAKYQICKLIMGLQSVDCDQACSASEGSMFDDDDDDDDDDDGESYSTSIFSSDYGDSLLFFSSDMLSEESSEEVEDLSEESFSQSDEDEKEKGSDGTKRVNGEASARRKLKCDLSSSCESEDIRVVVESLCEDVAENVAHHEHSLECCENYQRFKDESTVSTVSDGELTVSEPLSDSSW
ncbi:hypothetical protein OTU49_000706 [Cherax quadricarinatus]|uniref:Uncharacterized protein n=1 Tax=Cherax quadricarinatus TaxID=27406 RepID=A0AAW0XK71_CHEQU|nr:uncharacterized protein LOC128689804 [Cherax quadricarinatus]XP_053634259.1 uncharacterized protein LOC128689804 [Cherax quadricarinatus]XP_053634260.1 uncharacterized protein LOC128689804 [Cherax quadricarinatus]XP_053634261.1 uncharacterized protein LOC128689804 [Cherax quadricarinatus]XP_053634262.1 uncharacterized protein LOC128689804 [Cherax quadricarinatus]XP_053634263.1 uncharacterized protein LOC128689804 [Cherax quadricarinatus]XP_053634264.1 uncharacterized protein LOC128689804 [